MSLPIILRTTLAIMLVHGLTSPVQAGILSDITDAVIGHTKDITGRLQDDQVLEEAEMVRTATFRADDPGNDSAHRGYGEVSIVRKDDAYYLQFHPNFDSSFAPDPKIYLSNTKKIEDNASFNNNEQHLVAHLEKGSGASFYKIEGYDPSDIASVTIWCKRFSVFITSASFMK